MNEFSQTSDNPFDWIMDLSLDPLPPWPDFGLDSAPTENDREPLALARILPRGLYDLVVALFMTKCKSCEQSITFEYFHCSICEEGGYEICEACFDRGVICRNVTHVLSNRSLQKGIFFILGERHKKYSSLPYRTRKMCDYDSLFTDPSAQGDKVEAGSTLMIGDATIRQLGLSTTLAEAPTDELDMELTPVKLPERSRRPYFVHGGQRVVVPGYLRGTAVSALPISEVLRAEIAAARERHRSKYLRMAYWRCCQCTINFNNPAIGSDRCMECSHNLCEYCHPLDNKGNPVQDLPPGAALIPGTIGVHNKCRKKWCNDCAKDEQGLCRRCWDQGEYESWATSVFRYH